MRIIAGSFEWDSVKEFANVQKHGVDFIAASKVFADPDRKIFADRRHSKSEERLYCIGRVESRVMTVRFVYRDERIRVIGAGYWRKGKGYYYDQAQS